MSSKFSNAREADYFEEQIRRNKEGKIDDETFRRFRLQNGIYGIRFQKDLQMVRVKIPYGRLTWPQLRLLGEIAYDFSNGLGHVTTRQAIQFHWVALENVPKVIQRLAEVDLTTREACGNTVRNVTACPLAGVCEKEIFDVAPYANRIARIHLRNPLNQSLPRKFKISFSGCGEDCGLSGIHDIGIVATEQNTDGKPEKGFKIYIGGGLAPPPMAAKLLEEFTPQSELDATVEAVLRVFDRLGNRQDIARARLKFLIAKLGFEEFRKLVFHERKLVAATRPAPEINLKAENGKVEQGPHFAVLPLSSNPKFDVWLRTNVRRQKQPGYFTAEVSLPAGDIWFDQFFALSEIVRKFSVKGEARTSSAQTLFLHWIPESHLESVYNELTRIRLDTPAAGGICKIVGCPGADTCNLAITRSHRFALELFAELTKDEKLMTDADLSGSTIRISGCPNSCGHHQIATLGFFGAAQRSHGRLLPAYQMLLGGKAEQGNVQFGKFSLRIPARKVPAIIRRLVEMYRREKLDGERFTDWVARLRERDTKVLEKELADILEVPPFEQSPENYSDWGATEPFIVKTGRGECAA